jgi:sugar-specific transcriptional regulator TrmB
MRLTEQRLARLAQLGLTEAQARAYLALLELGPAGISEVAHAAGVPRTRLYPVFGELHGMGLVDILAEEPIRYAPRPLEEYLARRVESLERQRANLQDSIPSLMQEFRAGAAHVAAGGKTKVFRGRENALLHLAEALQGASRSVTLACTPRTLDRLRTAGLEERLARLPAQAASVDLLVPPGIQLNRPPGAEARTIHRLAADLPMEVLLVDGRGVVAWVPRPDDASVTEGEDEGIASASPAVFALFSAALVGLAGQRTPKVQERP